MPKHISPIFLSCNKDSAERTIEAVTHIANRASEAFTYYVHILHTDLPNSLLQRACKMAHKGCFIFFENVGPWLESARSLFPMPNCYEDPSHFYFYVADMFPEYRKAIYLSTEGASAADIDALYATDLGDCLLLNCDSLRHNHMSDRFLRATAQSQGKNLPGTVFLSQLCRDRVQCLEKTHVETNHTFQTSPAPAV